MPNINQIKQSKFLKRDDCGNGILVTITGCHQVNVAMEGAPPEEKWCLSFQETEKPMVLNTTNAQIIAAVCGSQETDDWTGKKVVLYDDPNVSFGGKLVGGIRARAPRGQAAAKPIQPVSRPAPPPDETSEADAPF